MMGITNKPLWIIEFDKKPPEAGETPSVHYIAPDPQEEKESDEILFLNTLQKFFSSVVKASLDDPNLPSELRKDLEGLSKNMDNFEKWIEMFKERGDATDDLSGQDPT
jgi:hypothetical protein